METRRPVVLHLAARAEALGYDAFFVAEGWGHDAGVLLAEVATRTDRITLGTGVLNVWGRTPATIAMLATSLAEASADRFLLGLGAGSPPLAEGLHDVEFIEPVQRLAAVTRQVRRLLNGQRIDATIERDNRPLKLAITPQRKIPIHLAALGPQSVRLAGELADGWAPFLLPLTGFGPSLGLLQEGAARRGSNRPLPLIAPCVPAAVSSDRATALEIASWWVAFYLTSMGPLYRETLRRLGHGVAVEQVLAANPTRGTFGVPESARVLLDELTLWGDAEHAGQGLARLVCSRGADAHRRPSTRTLRRGARLHPRSHVRLTPPTFPKGRQAAMRRRSTTTPSRVALARRARVGLLVSSLESVSSKSERQAAHAVVADYHDAQLGDLVAHVGEAVDQYRAGTLNAFEVDRVLFQYSRAAKELWKFCNYLQVDVAAAIISEQAPRDWWERGAPGEL